MVPSVSDGVSVFASLMRLPEEWESRLVPGARVLVMLAGCYFPELC